MFAITLLKKTTTRQLFSDDNDNEVYLFINAALCLDRFIFCNSNYCILNQLTSAMDKCNRNGFLLICCVWNKWWYS